MTKIQNLFFSCVDSRIQEQGSMYARFHLGPFVRGQSLTFANALRRTLLSEIPGVMITDVLIEGAGHEFATLPGVEETVLDILLNLKKLVFAPANLHLTELQSFQATGFLKRTGPAKLTAGDLKLPVTLKCIDPNAHVVTLTTSAEFSLRFNLQVRRPHQLIPGKKHSLDDQKTRKFIFDTVPMPVQKVNYVIKSLNVKQGSEYIVLEVWTDGSVSPQETVQFALKNLTSLFYQFATMSKEKVRF
uniref:Plastid-encoded RNA polymerase subunit alpha n=1 Tax=Micractinium sp. LBA 32 TaxID=1759591 RepID=A0A4Y6AAG7_9CHLO|nr:RNA polymerase alpha subunit [Micractinium sp. LBA 32]